MIYIVRKQKKLQMVVTKGGATQWHTGMTYVTLQGNSNILWKAF